MITSWTDALISWPRCKRAGSGKGRPTSLVTEELARAIRTESALAVGYWWGASKNLVRNWRAALHVTNESNVGSRRVIRAAAQKGGDAPPIHIPPRITAARTISARASHKERRRNRGLGAGEAAALWPS
jgi:hypothetical protein